MAARWVDEHIPLAAISATLFEKFGPAASPARVLALTPFELMALFTERPGADAATDPVAVLHRINHTVRAPKGLAPSAPPWLTRGRRAR